MLHKSLGMRHPLVYLNFRECKVIINIKQGDSLFITGVRMTVKKFITLLLCLVIVCLCWSSSVSSIGAVALNKALYVALGDSITSGYGLASFTNNDVNNRNSLDNYVTRLGKAQGIKTINLGVEGIDSTVFLKAISNPVTKEQKAEVAQIKKAGLISLSIGGNNIFIPLLNSVNDRVGNGKSIFNADASDIQKAVISLLFNQDALDKLKANISQGAEVFSGNERLHKTGDFTKIINTLKTLNPKANIIVQTIYNPFDFILPDTINKAILSMNAEIIKASDNGKNYRVADVYSAYAKAGKDIRLINAQSGKSFDPHPTKKGHEVIYTLMFYELNGKVPYKVNSNVVKGKSAYSVADGEFSVTITPDKGYKLPKTIVLTIGKSVKHTLELKNGAAAVPIAGVNGDITITAVCSR